MSDETPGLAELQQWVEAEIVRVTAIPKRLLIGMPHWTIPKFLAQDAVKHDPKTGEFTVTTAGSAQSSHQETEHHRNIKRYLARQGSYSSSGRGDDYRAAKELVKSDPSLKLEETLHPPEYDKYKRTGRGNAQGGHWPAKRTWKVTKS